MNKEYLEAFESIMKIYGNTNSLEGTYNYFLLIKKALQRLEAIDNANPSEALECLFRIGHNHREDYINGRLKKDYSIVEQALLKAQEPKHYLKWEDLTTTKTYECLLNGNEYVVDYYSPQECDPYWRVRLISPTRGVFIVLRENYDKQFFNDLHLELVKEYASGE